MKCGDLRLGLVSFTFGGASLDAPHLSSLVLPLPDLTSDSAVMAYSLHMGRLVRTFAHGIRLLPWVGYGLSWLVCMLGGFV